MKNMENLISTNQARKFYQEIRSVKKAYQPIAQFLEDEDGNLVTNIRELNVMWSQYFQNLLNCPPPTEDLDDNLQGPAEEEVEPLNFKEIKNAIMRLKNNKASGIDNLPSELWKYGGEALQSRFYNLIKMIWESEQQPVEWYSGVICPIHKKGSRKKCNFAKAYDSIDRSTLYRILTHFKIPQKLVRVVEVATRESRMTVRVGATLTDKFDVVSGLRQGDALSPMLFNLALGHAIIWKVNTLNGGVWLNGQHRVIGYAADLALLGERNQHVINALNCL
ncbi:uncharacterized protein LOC105843006 [Bombyx mori]|uniref:Reverse transcriptase domain-containing protein n=1 Tax=Bombyx mori TaxID=7091 RepID=A0A8R2GBS6_BOMMO|nr:uncharacterized protein LOC105843006 [Bombyx mori]